MLRTDRLLCQHPLAHSVQGCQSPQSAERIPIWYQGLQRAQQFRQRSLDCLAHRRHLGLAKIPTLDNHLQTHQAAPVGQ